MLATASIRPLTVLELWPKRAKEPVKLATLKKFLMTLLSTLNKEFGIQVTFHIYACVQISKAKVQRVKPFFRRVTARLKRAPRAQYARAAEIFGGLRAGFVD